MSEKKTVKGEDVDFERSLRQSRLRMLSVLRSNGIEIPDVDESTDDKTFNRVYEEAFRAEHERTETKNKQIAKAAAMKCFERVLDKYMDEFYAEWKVC